MIDIKAEFPIFTRYPDLVYLDNAATTQRPNVVIDSQTEFHIAENSNIHRGIYDLSNEATRKYEQTRLKVAQFMVSSNPDSIAFTKGTTESINIVAQSYLAKHLKPGDNVVTTIMEHHANFIPWQMICSSHEAELRVASVNDKGELNLDDLVSLINGKTRMVAVGHISNTLGTINEIEKIIEEAHRINSPVLIDAAQSASLYELPSDMGYDFLAYSGHKMFGPFGVGVLYANEKYISEIDPYNFGGGMIKEVTVEETSFSDYPFNLEAGTANISGVIGLSAALDFIEKLDRVKMVEHINQLTNYGIEQLSEINEVKLIGNASMRSGIISFLVGDIHPHDVSSFLNKDNIAVRAGMHCTQPLLNSWGIAATVRASFSIYNTNDDVDRLCDSIKALIKFWR